MYILSLYFILDSCLNKILQISVEILKLQKIYAYLLFFIKMLVNNT